MLPRVYYVGVDLAWGQRKPTGLAVLVADSAESLPRLVHISTVGADEEILSTLAPFTGGPCLVGFDAPLVVKNATGRRPAEEQLSNDFHRFHAGAYPSNTTNPNFRDGGRAARLSRSLKLDPDPRSGRDRRAIEVYPHPATVVLFGLSRILKYKHKPGRDLDLLRTELARLMGFVEQIVVTDQTWADLRHAVETATRKSQLRVVEDQVDAVVCAYVALFADRYPDRVTTYGDAATGYIVTPSVDAGAVLRDTRSEAVAAYARQRPELVTAGEQLTRLVVEVLDDAGIDYLTVTGRTKTVASFAEKAHRRRPDATPLYDEPLTQVTDQIGVRVIVYVPSDVAAVADLLHDQVVVRDDRDMGRETASEGRFGYASRHLLITLDAAREGSAELTALVGRVGQVQIRTVLQHAWAEFEHDIRYKGTVPAEHASEFDRRFTLAAGLLELADQEFTAIRDRLRGISAEPVQVADDPRLDPRELAVYLAGQYPQAGWSRPDHYGWISGLLLELGLTSFDEVGEVLARSDTAEIDARMDYRYPPGAVRRLDDALLAEFGDRYVSLSGNAHRSDALTARLARLSAA